VRETAAGIIQRGLELGRREALAEDVEKRVEHGRVRLGEEALSFGGEAVQPGWLAGAAPGRLAGDESVSLESPSRSRVWSWLRTALSESWTALASSSTVCARRRSRVTILPGVVAKKRRPQI
jgi:hypothetical protein